MTTKEHNSVCEQYERRIIKLIRENIELHRRADTFWDMLGASMEESEKLRSKLRSYERPVKAEGA